VSELSPGSVTTADLYRELVGLRGDLSALAIRFERVDVVNTAAEAVHNDHEMRLRALEAFRWKLIGACLLVSVIAGAAGSFVHH
jgi:hypothetical protein